VPPVFDSPLYSIVCDVKCMMDSPFNGDKYKSCVVSDWVYNFGDMHKYTVLLHM